MAQLSALLKLIHHPDNSYCIHVDKKTSTFNLKRVKAVAACYRNVYVTEETEFVYWGGFGILKAALNCAKFLLKINNTWKYLINISAQDFPLKTNREIIKILQTFNGQNNIQKLREPHFQRYYFKHVVMRDKEGIPVTHRYTI